MTTLKTIGVDLHKSSLTTMVLDEKGQVLERKDIPTKCRNQIREYFGSYGLQCQVAVEKKPELRRQVQLIESIPGIGRVTAATILAETGEITRFKNIDQLSAYAGLAPRVSQSGETVHHGHISKQGPPLLCWVFQQAAWTAVHAVDHVLHPATPGVRTPATGGRRRLAGTERVAPPTR